MLLYLLRDWSKNIASPSQPSPWGWGGGGGGGRGGEKKDGATPSVIHGNVE